MPSLSDIVARVVTGGWSAEETTKFLAGIWRLVVCTFMAYGLGLFGAESGFATEANTKRWIAEGFNLYLKELEKLNEKLERKNDIQERLLIEGIISRIRELNMACRAATSIVTKNRLIILIEDDQIAYKALTGERYPLNPPCE